MFLHNDRDKVLSLLIEGYKKTSIPLIMSNDSDIMPFTANGGDDLGIFILIPKLAKAFHLSADQATYAFFYGILAGGFLCAIAGLFLLFKDAMQRTIALIVTSTIFYITFKMNDVYITSTILIFALIPLFLYLLQKRNFVILNIFLLIAGILIGIGNSMRAYAGMGALLFMVIMLIAEKIEIIYKIVLLTMVLAGPIMTSWYFDTQFLIYQQYAHEHFDDVPSIVQRHPLWHTAYLGLGFTELNEIPWEDGYGFTKARQLDPSIKSDHEYEAIDKALRSEFFKILLQRPLLVGAIMFAKLGVLFYYLLICGNVFFIAMIYCLLHRRFAYIDGAFFALIGFNLLYPLIAIPIIKYSLGFIAAVLLYAVFIINNSIPITDTVMKPLLIMYKKMKVRSS